MLDTPIGLATSDSASGNVTHDVDSARLIMTYINAKDSPDRVLVISAWFVSAKGSGTYGADSSDPYMNVYAEDRESS